MTLATTVTTALVRLRQPTEFWTTLSASVLVLLVGGVLAAISYLAYRRERDRSFQLAALGFGLVATGNVVIVVYQVGIKGSFLLGGLELLRIQTLSGVLVVLGLLSLLYSLYRY
ncbi:DUF7521 family protein [Halococcus hamelinensis]|uniref:Uncharacterized protein n=1 Tax=Halococcus hamelinensis 100A6 TaxID=1132509 RepID=M0LSN1_9EURY|nr:hypothetical protein [Halococcus hamelinensis]EMA36451.1 hypothetical protein C447_14366 [Halococcus hamelinensis 100A6]